MLKILVEQGVEGGVPPPAVECRSHVQELGFGIAKVVVVGAALRLKGKNFSGKEPRVSVVPEQGVERSGIRPKGANNKREDGLGGKDGGNGRGRLTKSYIP